MQENKVEHHKLSIVQRMERNDIQDLQIEEIASVKQRNIFMENQFRPNIFKLLRNDKEINSFDYFRRHNLSMNSVIQNNFKLKISTYRSLSNLARKVITDSYVGKEKIIDHLNSFQMTMYPSDLQFADLLNMASNRISPYYLHEQMNKIESTDENESQTGENKIFYGKKQKNNKNRYIAPDEQIYQIQKYKNADKIDKQIDAEKLFSGLKKAILEQEQKIIKILSEGINDKDTIENLQNKLINKIQNAVGQKKSAREDKVLDYKKNNSNKVETIKLKAYQQLLAQRANFQKIKKNLKRNVQKNRGKFSK